MREEKVFSNNDKMKQLNEFLDSDSSDLISFICSFGLDFGIIDNDELPLSYIMVDDNFRRIVVNKAVLGDSNDYVFSLIRFISSYQLSFYVLHEEPIFSVLDISKLNLETYCLAQKIYASIMEKEQFNDILQRKRGGK